MSGIPQELLRQVRLEAAMDPPSAITLATEEVQLPARPHRHHRRNQQRNNNPPSSAADPTTKRRSAAEAWPEVRDELRASRAEFIRARSRMQAAGEALDDFLLEYLQEGPELTGEYPQRIADERAAQASYRAEHDRRADLRASTRAVELARAQLAGFQRTTASRTAALQRQLDEAEDNRWRTQRSAPGEAGYRAPLRKHCPVCELEGTTGRGRECPNRSAHGAIMARKAEDANQR